MQWRGQKWCGAAAGRAETRASLKPFQPCSVSNTAVQSRLNYRDICILHLHLAGWTREAALAADRPSVAGSVTGLQRRLGRRESKQCEQIRAVGAERTEHNNKPALSPAHSFLDRLLDIWLVMTVSASVALVLLAGVSAQLLRSRNFADYSLVLPLITAHNTEIVC